MIADSEMQQQLIPCRGASASGVEEEEELTSVAALMKMRRRASNFSTSWGGVSSDHPRGDCPPVSRARCERGFLFGYTRAIANDDDAVVVINSAAAQLRTRLRVRVSIMVLSLLSVAYNVAQALFFPDQEAPLVFALVNSSTCVLSCILVTNLYRAHGLFSPFRRWLMKRVSCFQSVKRSLLDVKDLANLSAHARLSRSKYVLEMLIYAVHCPPVIHHYFPGLRILDFACAFRILFSVMMFLVNFTRFKRPATRVLANLAGVAYDSVGLSRLSLRWILRRHPLRALVPFVLFAWTVLAFSFHYCEPYDLGTSFWFILATASTVGYGDVIPTTWKGRIVAGIAIAMGLFFVGYLVSAVQGSIQLEDKEERLFNVEYHLRMRRVVKIAAANLIARAWRLSQLHKAFAISTHEHRKIVATSKRSLNSDDVALRGGCASSAAQKDQSLMASFIASFWVKNTLSQLDTLEEAVDRVQVAAAEFRLLRKDLSNHCETTLPPDMHRGRHPAGTPAGSGAGARASGPSADPLRQERTVEELALRVAALEGVIREQSVLLRDMAKVLAGGRSAAE
jgi:hypothetical protein